MITVFQQFKQNQISRKGEIYVDFKYKADGIIPKGEYSDDASKNPNDEFEPGDTITADVLKWNDGLGNVLLSYKKYKKREDAIKEKTAVKAVFLISVKNYGDMPRVFSNPFCK